MNNRFEWAPPQGEQTEEEKTTEPNRAENPELQEPAAQPQEPEQPRSRERARRFLNTCGIALISAFVEFAGTANAQPTPEYVAPTKEREPAKVLYRSAEAERKLKEYERFYPDLSEVKTPIVVGSMEEELNRLDPTARGRYEMQFSNVGAFTISGSHFPEAARIKFGMGKDTTYILYGTGEMFPENQTRIPYHEGLHAIHFAERYAVDPEDTTGYLRYEELSREANMCLEELITGAGTIAWLEEQARNPKAAGLSDEEAALLPKAIRKERRYFRDNYFAYYHARYGGGFDVPAGEWITDDGIDREVENLFKQSDAIKVLGDFSDD